MNRMPWKIRLCLGLVCLGLGFTNTSFAQTPESVDRYLTSNTIAGVRIDLDRIDLNALRNKALEWKVLDQELDREMLSGLPFARSILKGFVAAGAEELWVLADLASIMEEGPTMILTVAPGDDSANKTERLAATLELLGPKEMMHVENDHIVVCPPSAWQLYQQSAKVPEERKLPESILKDRSQMLTAFYAPSADHLRAMTETLPQQLPPPFSEINPRAALSAIEYAQLNVHMKPAVSLNAEIKTDSRGDAEQLKNTLGKLTSIMEQMPEIDRAVPGFSKLLPMIPVEVSDERLTMEVSEANGQISKLVDALAAPIRAARVAAGRTQSMNNIKQIMLAFHNYHDANRGFPLRASVDEEGKRLLSWRVHLLPYLEQYALYQQFHLDEPWDSEHNKALIEKCPEVFRSPGTPNLKSGLTNYVVPIAENTFLSTTEPMQFSMMIDGTSNTLGVLETDADHAVIWTKPDDLKVDFKNPLAGLLLWNNEVILASRVDGSVQAIVKSIDPEVLQNLLQYNDGNVVNQ